MTSRPAVPNDEVRKVGQFLKQHADTVRDWAPQSDAAHTLAMASRMVLDLVDNPINRWVTVDEVARILDVSCETVRRWVRTGTANFTWERDTETGQIRVWLPTVRATPPVIDRAA